MGFADLKYIGGFHEYLYTLLVDWDNTSRPSYAYTSVFVPVPVTVYGTVGRYIEDKRYQSNELDLISTGDGPLQYVFGLYQYDEHIRQPFDIFSIKSANLATTCYAANATFTGCLVPAPANPDRDYYLTDQASINQSFAGFTQFDWKFTDTWKATVGLRYTIDRKNSDEYTRLTYWDPTLTGPLAPVLDITNPLDQNGNAIGTRLPDGRVTRHLDGKWHGLTGTAGMEWTPVQGSLGYWKFTRGYKAGGINAGAVVANPFTDPEFVNAYEIGWKQDIAQRVQANVSAFYYDYQGQQVPLTVTAASGPNVTNVFNIDSKNFGLELETIYRATDALQVSFNYAYLNTKLSDPNGCYADVLAAARIGPRPCVDSLAKPGQKIDGDTVPGSPRNKFSLNALYTFTFSPGSLSLSGSYVWRDKTYSSVFETDEWLVKSWGQADFRATWTNSANSYSVVAYAKNAFDSLGYDGVASGFNGAGAFQTVSVTNPRTFGVQLQYRLGAAAK